MIKEICLKEKSTNPVEIAEHIMKEPEVPIHGPVHHIIDGASLITAMHNAGMDFELEAALTEIENRGQKMPGATCGMWGMCGSCSSVGAAVAIARGTGPLSDNQYYKDNMKIVSAALERIAEIGGPRCCKRNAFISLVTASEYLRENYNIGISTGKIRCGFSPMNQQCIRERCPFYGR